jgi:hypothetical protein
MKMKHQSSRFKTFATIAGVIVLIYNTVLKKERDGNQKIKVKCHLLRFWDSINKQLQEPAPKSSVQLDIHSRIFLFLL